MERLLNFGPYNPEKKSAGPDQYLFVNPAFSNGRDGARGEAQPYTGHMHWDSFHCMSKVKGCLGPRDVDTPDSVPK